jgi:DeoR/GlpR family transcriptional regulator of sugar metabolism
VTLAALRRAEILVEVREARSVNVTELSRRFGVSSMTVRRDLEALSRTGELTRVHGGAMAGELSSGPVATLGRPAPAPADLALAKAASQFIRSSSTIALTTGTATYALARRVATMPSVNVVTNSVWVAEVLHENNRAATTLVTGGLGTAAGGMVGPWVANTLRGMRLDVLFMDADGIDVRAGLTTAAFADAVAIAAFMDAADNVVVLAPSARWGTRSLCTIAPLDAIDTLVTDRVTLRMQSEIGRNIPHIVCVNRPDGRASLRPGRSADVADRTDRQLA